MDTPTPPTPAPASTPSLQSKGNIRVIAYLISGLVLIIVIGIYWFLHSSYGAFYGTRYLSGEYEIRSLQEMGLRSSHTVAFPGSGRVIDYAHAGSDMVAIKVDEKGKQDIYELGKTPIALTTDGRTKSGLAISSDGSMIAYAIRIPETVATSTKAFYAIDDWRVQLLNVKDKSIKDVGVGFAPQLFMSNGKAYLAYLTNSSIHIVTIDTFATQDVPYDFGTQYSYLTIAVSADGKFAILPDLADNYRLYALSNTGGIFRLVAGSSLPEHTSTAVFKGNTIVSASFDTEHSLIRISTIQQPDIIRFGRTISRSLIFKLIP